jgi:hypothetical protein
MIMFLFLGINSRVRILVCLAKSSAIIVSQSQSFSLEGILQGKQYVFKVIDLIWFEFNSAFHHSRQNSCILLVVGCPRVNSVFDLTPASWECKPIHSSASGI